MKYILAATNRPGSNTRILANLVQGIYRDLDYPTKILSLEEINFSTSLEKPYLAQGPKEIEEPISWLNHSSGITIICPEYNGSFPGILKFFIDHWSYPETFEYRPMAFIGLGGQFGALRAVEQLQQTMGYRNAFIYPNRVFIQNVSECLVDGAITDSHIWDLLKQQAKGFIQFISALEKYKLTANKTQNS